MSLLRKCATRQRVTAPSQQPRPGDENVVAHNNVTPVGVFAIPDRDQYHQTQPTPTARVNQVNVLPNRICRSSGSMSRCAVSEGRTTP